MNRMTIGKEKSVNRMTISWITAGVFALAVGSVGAHHSMTMFDPVKEVTLEGVVKEFQYTNPHSWLLVDVTNEDGTVTTWGFEAEGPSTLRRGGDFAEHLAARPENHHYRTSDDRRAPRRRLDHGGHRRWHGDRPANGIRGSE